MWRISKRPLIIACWTVASGPEPHPRHRRGIRALHDAILVGINTVICDDPRLTVRLTSGQSPQPIVLDSQLRFPLGAKLMRDPCLRPIIATGPDACSAKEDQLTAAGARVIRVPLQVDGLIDLVQLLPRIKQLGLHSVMVEGGAKVITSMLASRIADHTLLAISPRFVAGMRAVNPTNNGRQMPTLHDVHFQSMEGDLVVWGHLDPMRDPGGARKSAATASQPLPE